MLVRTAVLEDKVGTLAIINEDFLARIFPALFQHGTVATARTAELSAVIKRLGL